MNAGSRLSPRDRKFLNPEVRCMKRAYEKKASLTPKSSKGKPNESITAREQSESITTKASGVRISV